MWLLLGVKKRFLMTDCMLRAQRERNSKNSVSILKAILDSALNEEIVVVQNKAQ